MKFTLVGLFVTMKATFTHGALFPNRRSTPHLTKRIYDGRSNAKINQHYYMASLIDTSVKTMFCGNIDSVICAGTSNGKDVCTGDGGGPLLVKDVMVNIVTSGPGDCGVLFGKYTPVSYALDFMNDIVDGKSTDKVTEKLTAGTKLLRLKMVRPLLETTSSNNVSLLKCKDYLFTL